MDELKRKYNLIAPAAEEKSGSRKNRPARPAVLPEAEEGEPLLVVPHTGIGALKLGMSPEQIFEGIMQTVSDLPRSGGDGLQISRDIPDEEGGFTLRYQKGAVFFMVRYENGQAAEISVDRGFAEYAPVLLRDRDVFKTQADQLIASLKECSPCFFDGGDEEPTTEFLFPRLGIRLWREEPFHHQLPADKSGRNTMPAVTDDMIFDMVTVKAIDRTEAERE